MRAEQVISGATRIVVSRSRRLSITRADMIPGMAQAKARQQRDEGAAMQPGAAHDAVHQERRPRHVAEILQQQDEQKQDDDLRQETTTTLPTPEITPFCRKLCSKPSGSMEWTN